AASRPRAGGAQAAGERERIRAPCRAGGGAALGRIRGREAGLLPDRGGRAVPRDARGETERMTGALGFDPGAGRECLRARRAAVERARIGAVLRAFVPVLFLALLGLAARQQS